MYFLSAKKNGETIVDRMPRLPGVSVPKKSTTSPRRSHTFPIWNTLAH